VTVVNLTLLKDRSAAVLSTDAAIAPAGDAATTVATATDLAADSPAVAPGDHAPCHPIGFMSKLAVVPHLHAAFVVAGVVDALSAVVGTAVATGPDIRALPDLAPHLGSPLADVARRHGGAAQLAFGAGWVPNLERVAAFMWGPDGDYAAVELAPTHAVLPSPHPAEAGYDAIAAGLAHAALDAADAVALHRMIGRNQFAAYRAGRLRPGVALGGRLSVATVDARGVRVELFGKFDAGEGASPGPLEE